MQAYPDQIDLVTVGDDSQMVALMRIALALAALLTTYIDQDARIALSHPVWISFYAYACHSFALYVLSRRRPLAIRGRTVHWLDVGWYSLLILLTGGAGSFFFSVFLLRHPDFGLPLWLRRRR